MSEYDEAIRLEPGDDPTRRTGTFTEDWMIGNAVNGGLVMATGLQALGQRLAADPAEETKHSDPVVMSAYFMTASAPGPFTVATDVMRCGRMLSTGQISLSQPDADGVPVERMRAIASFGNLEQVDTFKQSTPPDMPPPEHCVSSEQAPPEFLANMRFLERLDLRLDPATAGWALGKPSMKGVIRGWLRLKDAREPDTTLLMMALDALPPVAFDLGILGWTPTLEFTGHIRRRPAPGWLQVSLSSENVGGGMMEEDASIWDSSGALVAQSRQLCGVRLSTGRTG